MGLHLIIVGYNLIRQSGALARVDRRDIAAGRDALLRRLAAYRRLKPHRVTVVFDGAGATEAVPERDLVMGVRVVFSRQGETADNVIARMARNNVGSKRRKSVSKPNFLSSPRFRLRLGSS